LKSRAIWLKEGNRNIKIFHKYANVRKNVNTIWKIKNRNGDAVFSTKEIQVEEAHFFENFYQAHREVNIDDILWGIQDYPHMFNEAHNDFLFRLINLEEIH